MLGDHDSIAVLAVTDLDRARTFYEEVLGLTSPREAPEGVLYTAGSSVFLVYPSSFAGTNRATAMSFQIPGDQFDAEVQTLRERGVTFSTFEAEGLTWVDGVASYDDFKSAWFEDPDGNILNLETGV
jgi:catechol 2,3-dioxygenase-like lactoylglutathione lyase family enzyme